jgi:two-component system, OmpR family, sensor histidine kinase TctE
VQHPGAAPHTPTAMTGSPQNPQPTEDTRTAQGLRRRLLVLLMVPLGVLAVLSVWLDYRAAGTVAQQYDQQLLRHLPQLANSVVGSPPEPGEPPLVLMAPAVAEFLKDRGDFSGYRVSSVSGALLHGDLWIDPLTPRTTEPELHSVARNGVIYRVAAQRVTTSAGEYVVQLADGSDPRQQWWQSVVLKVLLPNGVVVLAAGLVVHWAVRRALAPLQRITQELAQRSPRDLSSIDSQRAPEEVRPLIGALNHLFELVSAQAESQRRFVADAAHQLRTPLAGLQAQVEAWAEQATRAQAAALKAQARQASQASVQEPGHENPPQALSSGTMPAQPLPAAAPPEVATAPAYAISLSVQDLHKLRNATRRTSQLANQLLALSRADAQAMQAQPMQNVDLKALCEECLSNHLDAAIAKRIDLGLDAEAVQVQGHEWLLRELLANLTSNAIKYTPRGGAVTIRCGLRGGSPFVEVEDDGPGIPEAERARVTERFYRVGGSPGEGNGLGLAIAFEIASLHSAQWVLTSAQSQPGMPSRPGLRAGLVFEPGKVAQ